MYGVLNFGGWNVWRILLSSEWGVERGCHRKQMHARSLLDACQCICEALVAVFLIVFLDFLTVLRSLWVLFLGVSAVNQYFNSILVCLNWFSWRHWESLHVAAICWNSQFNPAYPVLEIFRASGCNAKLVGSRVATVDRLSLIYIYHQECNRPDSESPPRFTAWGRGQKELWPLQLDEIECSRGVLRSKTSAVSNMMYHSRCENFHFAGTA